MEIDIESAFRTFSEILRHIIFCDLTQRIQLQSDYLTPKIQINPKSGLLHVQYSNGKKCLNIRFYDCKESMIFIVSKMYLIFDSRGHNFTQFQHQRRSCIQPLAEANTWLENKVNCYGISRQMLKQPCLNSSALYMSRKGP